MVIAIAKAGNGKLALWKIKGENVKEYVQVAILAGYNLHHRIAGIISAAINAAPDIISTAGTDAHVV